MRCSSNTPAAVLIAALLLLAVCACPAAACARFLFTTADNVTLTARIMDSNHTQHESIWVLPAGLERVGAAAPAGDATAGIQLARWTSKYGVMAMVGGNMSLPDGMNEKGLVVNQMRQDYSSYDGNATCSMPGMTNMHAYMLTAYLLDNFASVKEAVKALKADPPHLLLTKAPDDTPESIKEGQELYPLHWSLSDPSGDSAIIEWQPTGEMAVWQGPEFTTLVNMPTYGEHLAVTAYYRDYLRWSMVPGSTSSLDRFVRFAYVTDQMRASNISGAEFEGVLTMLSAVRANSLWPQPSQPPQKYWWTAWRVMYDQLSSTRAIPMVPVPQKPDGPTLYYDSSSRPGAMLWAPLAPLLKGGNFTAGAPPMVVNAAWLPPDLAGDITTRFAPAEEPFTILAGVLPPACAQV